MSTAQDKLLKDQALEVEEVEALKPRRSIPLWRNRDAAHLPANGFERRSRFGRCGRR